MTYTTFLDPFFAQWNVRILGYPHPLPLGVAYMRGDTWVMLRVLFDILFPILQFIDLKNFWNLFLESAYRIIKNNKIL